MFVLLRYQLTTEVFLYVRNGEPHLAEETGIRSSKREKDQKALFFPNSTFILHGYVKVGKAMLSAESNHHRIMTILHLGFYFKKIEVI